MNSFVWLSFVSIFSLWSLLIVPGLAYGPEPDALDQAQMILGSEPAGVFNDFVKSDQDKCEYRLITLPNQLQALLVSDPTIGKVPALLRLVKTNVFLGQCSFGR